VCIFICLCKDLDCANFFPQNWHFDTTSPVSDIDSVSGFAFAVSFFSTGFSLATDEERALVVAVVTRLYSPPTLDARLRFAKGGTRASRRGKGLLGRGLPGGAGGMGGTLLGGGGGSAVWVWGDWENRWCSMFSGSASGETVCIYGGGLGGG